MLQARVWRDNIKYSIFHFLIAITEESLTDLAGPFDGPFSSRDGHSAMVNGRNQNMQKYHIGINITTITTLPDNVMPLVNIVFVLHCSAGLLLLI